MPDPQIDKPTLIANIQRDRARLDELVASLDNARLLEPALDGGWCVKDALAHITAWEQRCLGWIRAGERGEPNDRPEDGLDDEAINAFNASVYERNRDRALADVLAESKRSYAEMLVTAERLSDADLTSTGRWSWTHGRPLSLFVSANADDHYREHIAQIEACLAEPKR